MLSASGAITLNSGPNGLGLHQQTTAPDAVGHLFLGSKAGTDVTSSTANIRVEGDSLTTNTGSTFNVASTGTLTVEPTSGAFSGAVSTAQWSLGSSLSELTIGKQGNTANVTIGSATTVAGPITVYGGNINLSADIAVTTAHDLKLLASKDIVASTGTDLSTQGGDILLAANTDGMDGGAILITGTTIKSYGGDITLGGGNTTGSDYAEGSSFGTFWQRYRGVWINQTTIDASGGNIQLRGRGWQGASWGAGSHVSDYAIGVDIQTGSVITTSGTGTIEIDGVGGINDRADTFGSGVSFYDGPKIFTDSGNISISGTAGTSLTARSTSDFIARSSVTPPVFYDITLDNGGNDFGSTVSSSGANVSLADGTDGIVLGQTDERCADELWHDDGRREPERDHE